MREAERSSTSSSVSSLSTSSFHRHVRQNSNLRRDVRPVLPRRTRTFDEDEMLACTRLMVCGGGGTGDNECTTARSNHRTRAEEQQEEQKEEEEPTQTCTSEHYSRTIITEEEKEEQDIHVIELMGGVCMPLRLTQETEKAWSMNRHSEACCFVCETRVACVDDCDSFICPECLSIVPLERKNQHDYVGGGSLSWSVPHRGGVGIGLKIG